MDRRNNHIHHQIYFSLNPPAIFPECNTDHIIQHKRNRETRARETELGTDLRRSGWRQPWSVHPLCAWWRDVPSGPAVMHPSRPQHLKQSAPHSGWNVPEKQSINKGWRIILARYSLTEHQIWWWNLIDPCEEGGAERQRAVKESITEKKTAKLSVILCTMNEILSMCSMNENNHCSCWI